jgi:hypothetical protein
MLGITAEAEDVVPKAFARWHQASRSAVRSPWIAAWHFAHACQSH